MVVAEQDANAVLTGLVGTQVGEHYVIDDLIVCGGQAAVFRAHNRALANKLCALKVYGPYESRREATAHLAEAEKQSHVQHPGVLTVDIPFTHECRHKKQELFLLCTPMPLATHGSAEAYEHFQGTLSTEHIQDLARLVDGVRYIHRVGLLHSDLKPANLLLFEEAGRVVMKIADFGIAQFGGLRKAAYGLTPAYSPPEQLRGAPCTPAADVYSLGATLYFLLTAKSPFELPEGAHGSIDDWLRVHEDLPRPDATLSNEYCPADLALLLIRMMAPLVTDRPSVDDCLILLEGVRESLAGRASGYKPSGQQARVLAAWPNTPSYVAPEPRRCFAPEVHKTFGRELWFIQLSSEHALSLKVFRLAIHYFGEQFCLHETYGPDDFLLRVWASVDRVEDFCRIAQAEDYEISKHLVSRVQVPRFKSPAGYISPVAAVALQQGKSLHPQHDEFVIRDLPKKDDGQVHAFTLIQPRSNKDRNNRGELSFMFYSVAQELPEHACPVLYWFTEACRYLGLVEFRGGAYEEMWRVALSLSAIDGGRPFKTTTQLSTKRLVFEGEGVRV